MTGTQTASQDGAGANRAELEVCVGECDATEPCLIRWFAHAVHNEENIEFKLRSRDFARHGRAYCAPEACAAVQQCAVLGAHAGSVADLRGSFLGPHQSVFHWRGETSGGRWIRDRSLGGKMVFIPDDAPSSSKPSAIASALPDASTGAASAYAGYAGYGAASKVCDFSFHINVEMKQQT